LLPLRRGPSRRARRSPLGEVLAVLFGVFGVKLAGDGSAVLF
jgi:hypothetical protein